MTRRLVTTLATLAATVALAAPALAQVQARPGTDRAERSPAAPTATPRVHTPAVPDQEFLLPHFVVDRTVAGGETTLFALRNTTADSVVVEATYVTDEDDVIGSEVVTLAPFAVFTRNLRDIAALPTVQGVARGYVYIEVFSPGAVTTDTFRVTPDQDFAGGETLIDLFQQPPCTITDARFAEGGPFDGGTRLTVWVADPPSGADPVIAEVDVFDQTGEYYGTVDLVAEAADVVTFEISVEEILQALPGPRSEAPNFGVVEIHFPTSVLGGYVGMMMSAEERYTVAIARRCIAEVAAL